MSLRRDESTPSFSKAKDGGLTVVIKVGTSSLLHPASLTLNLGNLARICETARDLVADGHRVVLVSSGAVGAGAARLGLASRPTDLAAKQALAAIGQVHLMRRYDDFLSALRLTCAQVLLTLDNLAVRSQWRAAASTFEALFAAGSVVPVVNENDTVAVAELRIGDNDTLSAQVATLVRADWLFLMTDVDALYTANPAADPKAARVAEVHDLSALAVNTTGEADGKGGGDGGQGASAAASASDAAAAAAPTSNPPVPAPPATAAAAAPSGAGTQWGTGGMATKLTAARIATAAGCSVAVLHAARPETIRAVIAGDPSAGGTVFHAIPHPSRGRKRWITSVPVKGRLLLDTGAVRAVRERGASLFAAGVVGVEGGEFDAQEAVLLVAAADGGEIARGLVNYSSGEVRALVAAARRGAGGNGSGGASGAPASGDGGRSGSGSGGNRDGASAGASASNHSGSGASHSAEAVLGYHGPDELVHRGNIVMLAPRAPTPTPAVMRMPQNSSSGSPSSSSVSAAAAAAAAAAVAAAAAAAAASAAAAAAAAAKASPPSSLSAEERLRQIRERDGGGGGGGGASSSRPRVVSFDDPSSKPSANDDNDDDDDGAMHAAAEAAAVEAAAELAAASLNGGNGAGGEDIDERGWLPK